MGLELDPEIVKMLDDYYDRIFPNGEIPDSLVAENPPPCEETPQVADVIMEIAMACERPSTPLAFVYDDVSPWGTPTSAHCDSRTADETVDEAACSATSARGIKRLREVYGEYDTNCGIQFSYPDIEQISPEPCTSTTVDYPKASTSGTCEKRAKFDSDQHTREEVCSEQSEAEGDNEQDHSEGGLEIFLESQADVLDAAVSERDSSSISSCSSDPGAYYRPIYKEADVNTLNIETLRSVNRNFLRILDIVSQPLTFQETEDLVYGSMREVVGLLRTVIERQNQLASDVTSVAAFLEQRHEQIEAEHAQQRHIQLLIQQELEQVRGDQQLSTVALSLFSEGFKVIQRQLRG
ncbi:hypothetical protein R3I93_004666 [Phoxinus phoxinus]|uniref:Uncharacterized protein n=1 Tax=Phoxinus phoxinus TaxID=58324 RepID=A0AAN9DKS9_9TELE